MDAALALLRSDPAKIADPGARRKAFTDLWQACGAATAHDSSVDLRALIDPLLNALMDVWSPIRSDARKFLQLQCRGPQTPAQRASFTASLTSLLLQCLSESHGAASAAEAPQAE